MFGFLLHDWIAYLSVRNKMGLLLQYQGLLVVALRITEISIIDYRTGTPVR